MRKEPRQTSCHDSEISATTKGCNKLELNGDIAKIIESQQIRNTLDTLNPAPAIVKWQQVQQFKLQVNNLFPDGQYQSNIHYRC